MRNLRSRGHCLIALGTAVLLASCSGPDEREARYLRHGIDLFDTGAYQQARIEFLNAARIKPADPEPLYRLGLINEALGDAVNAFRTFSTAATQDPHYIPAKLKLAQYFLFSDQLNPAAEQLDQILADQPKNADAQALRGALMLRRNDLVAAEKQAQLALAEDPDNAFAVAAMVGVDVANRDEEATVKTLDRALLRHPNDIPLRTLAISAYAQFDDLPRLEAAYQAIFKLTPPARNYRAELADRYTRAGRLSDAEQVLRAGVAEAPKDQAMRRLLIDFLSRNRGVPAADAEIRAEIAADPENRDLPFILADLYSTHGDTDKAEVQLVVISKTAALPADRLRADALRARLALALNRPQVAQDLVDRVLAVEPTNHEALYVRATLYFSRGLLQNAVTDLRTITREDPQNAKAEELLAELLTRQGHLDLAIDTLSQVVEHDPSNMFSLVRLAQFYHAVGNSSQALDLLNAATKAVPDNQYGWESTARIAEDMKDWNEAATAIARLGALAGEKSLAQFLDARLLAGKGKTAEAITEFAQVAGTERTGPLAEHALDAIIEVEQKQGTLAAGADLIKGLAVDAGLKASAVGRIEFALGQSDAAAASLDQAIQADIRRPELYTERASLAVRAHALDQAVTILRNGASRLPADNSIAVMLGDTLGLAGQYDAAMEVYGKLLDRDPGVDIAANNLAAMIADHAYTDHATLEHGRNLAERFRASDNRDFLDTLGWVYYREGAYDEALGIFDRMTRLGALSPIMHYHYGAVLMGANRREEAKRELTVALDSPTFADAAEARKMLMGM